MKVDNIKQLLEYIYRKNPVSGDYCFRGQADSDWKIIPKIHRIGLKRYQTVIAEAFLLYFLKDNNVKKTHIYTKHPIEFLAMCQHYGVETRLLDWTNDILIALYFACEQINDKDGALHICNKTFYKNLDFNKFRENVKEPLFINTHIINPRLRSQSGCFMIWGALPMRNETSETYNLEEYNEVHFDTNPIDKVIIPRKHKKSFLNELNEKYGINKNSVYLNNDFSKQTEKEYEVFKKISDVITYELTRSGDDSEPFNLPINLAGCLNLQSLPENPPNGFTEFILGIVKRGFIKTNNTKG